MTNYHPDPQRAYESHCADGYVVPDDETGPQEATGGPLRDFPCCDAPRDGKAAERRGEGQGVIGRVAQVIYESDWPRFDDGLPEWSSWDETSESDRADYVTNAQALAAAGLLADPTHEHVHNLLAGVRDGDGWTVQLGGVLMAKCDTYGKTATHGALDETLDDLTRTLARAEKAEAEVERLREMVGLQHKNLALAQKAKGDAWAERDRARDAAAALEAQNAALTEALREVYRHIGKPAVIVGQASMPIRYESARKAAVAALSDTTGEAS